MSNSNELGSTSYNPKYRMTFSDVLGQQFVIDLCFQDYAGEITNILLGEKPLELTVNGNEDELYNTIHTSKVRINLFQEEFNQELYDDINNLTDKSCYVKIDGSFIWRGWLIPDLSIRTFSNLSTTQTLYATDLFSYLKGVPAVDDDGKILYGKIPLVDLLENAFKKAIVEPFQYEIVSNMTISNTAPELQGHNILEQISIAAESFNDESGRPPMCYDVIQKVLHGLGLTCSLQGEKVIITDIVSENLEVFKEIKIKEDSGVDILINNDEEITKTRAAKELSALFNYNRTTGILPDGFFADWTGAVLNQWTWNVAGTTGKVGNGRAENPYGVKLTTQAYDVSGTTFYKTASLRNKPYRGLLSDSSYKIDFNVKYFDWRRLGIEGLPNPQLQFGMLLDGVSGKRYTLWQENGYSKNQSLWAEMEKDGGGNYVRDRDTFFASNGDTSAQGLFTRRSISLDSTEARQKLSYDIPPIPEDGTLYVYIQSAYINGAIGQLIDHEDRSSLTYYSVILSENLSVNANGVGGEKHYLTNFGDYSLISETETFELETGLNESVAGSIYNAIEFNIPIPEINANNYPAGSQINFMNTTDAGLFNANLSLVALILQNRMYYMRYSNYQVNLTFRSNTAKFQDLIRLVYKGVDLLPGVYKQLNLKYDVKKCNQSVTIFQLRGERRGFIKDAESDPTHDKYEFYYQTNG